MSYTNVILNCLTCFCSEKCTLQISPNKSLCTDYQSADKFLAKKYVKCFNVPFIYDLLARLSLQHNLILSMYYHFLQNSLNMFKNMKTFSGNIFFFKLQYLNIRSNNLFTVWQIHNNAEIVFVICQTLFQTRCKIGKQIDRIIHKQLEGWING